MRRIQRKTADYPQVIEEAKRDFEDRGLGYRVLSKKYGIPRSTVAYLATSRKWMRPGPPPRGIPSGYVPARHVEMAIPAEGLHEYMPGGSQKGETAADTKRPRGRPRKHPRPEEILIEPRRTSSTSSEIPLVCESEWLVRDPRPCVSAPAETGPAGFRGQLGRVKREGTKAAGTASIIQFPTPAPPAQKRVGGVPELTRDEKGKLRETLTAMRERMTVEQVTLLDDHEGLLRRYHHLLEVYLDTEQFVASDGLTDDEYRVKVEELRSFALQMLVPTGRDSLAGTIKTLTNAIHETVALKRSVAGLGMAKGTAAHRGASSDGGDSRRTGTTDLASLSASDLRFVQQAMEILERHQHERCDAPMPPPPESIDDLLL